MDPIKISKNLKFDFDDLMLYVDFDCHFTLKDVLNCIKNSKISINILKQILRCNYLEEYIDEVNKKAKKISVKMKYLEISCIIENWKEDGFSSYLSFYGFGTDKTIKYAIEFTPLYEMSHLPIKISDKVAILDYVNKKFDKEQRIPLSLTLAEFLYIIIYEISWHGSIKNREAESKELKRRAKSIEDGNCKLIPWNSFKKDLLKKIKRKMKFKK